MAKNLRLYRQDFVWKWIKKHPGCLRREIVAALGLPNRVCGHLLVDMKAAGRLRREGASVATRWYAVGAQPPTDGRGLSEGSQRALIGAESWMEHLPMAFAARGIHGKRFSRCEERPLMFKSRREHAPGENVRIPTLADLCGALVDN